MSRRLTAADAHVTKRPTDPYHQVEAIVTGAGRRFVVDRLSDEWFCTCRISTAHPARECAHIRATKEALNEHAS